MDYTKEKISGVYKITNPKGKVYIGQSSNINRRMIEHKYRAKKSNLKLYNSINKYGIDNHLIEILFIGESSYEKDKIEQMYITKLECISKGLNHVDVEYGSLGFTGKKHSKEVVDNIKKRMKGYTPTCAIEKIKKKVYCGLNNKEYSSITDFAKDFGVNRPSASMALNGQRYNKFKLELV